MNRTIDLECHFFSFFFLQLHYTFNRNLMDEEDQDIDDHLNRRRIRARRLSLKASDEYVNRQRSQHSANGHDKLPGQITSDEDEGQGKLNYYNS